MFLYVPWKFSFLDRKSLATFGTLDFPFLLVNLYLGRAFGTFNEARKFSSARTTKKFKFVFFPIPNWEGSHHSREGFMAAFFASWEHEF